MLTKIVLFYAARSRARRARMFLDYLRPSENDRILDFGGGDGSYMASMVPFRTNVYIADILQGPLDEAKRKFGFRTVLVDESATIPFPDKCFDIIFCSAVIEHVTVDKKDMYSYQTNTGFAADSLARQRRLADEIRRVSKRYFVQTPNKYFLIESHTWLPFLIVLFPRRLQIKTIRFFNKWWPKKTSPDWHLLTTARMQHLFPDAQLDGKNSLDLSKYTFADAR